eukprot:scaffold15316_cov67-Attheya_sp.AAC.1
MEEVNMPPVRKRSTDEEEGWQYCSTVGQLENSHWQSILCADQHEIPEQVGLCLMCGRFP